MATDETDWDTGGSPDALKPGTSLSDTYEIVRHLATGGMAEVYRARNIHTDEPVAIKVVLPAFAKDETILALFKKEATVLSRLHHDAIVHYHLFTVEKEMKRPYLVMEFVDGTALSDHIKRAPLDVQSTRILIMRVASGLAAAHALGVIHRDLSPDNVILPDDDVAKTKIIDFGIAKAAAVGKGTLLGDKFAGKYNYVSPEQLGLAGGEITPRSDMYSLGLIAAAALTGRAIDMTGSGSHVDVIDRRREVPDLSAIDPSIRPVIAAMLQPKPADRPKDMQAVIELLSGGQPVPGMTIPPRQQTSMPPVGTGTVFGAEMPGTSYPPQSQPRAPADDPWKDPTRIHSQPPQQQNPPPVDYGYQQSQPPGYGQQPPQGYGQPPQQPAPQGYGNDIASVFTPSPQQSVPGYSMPPTSIPPTPMPPPPQAPGQPFSESPFGPYVEKPGEPKFKVPPAPKAPEKGKKKSGGAPVGLIAVAAVVVIGGVGALGFTQGWFGGSTPTVTPTVTPTATATATVTPTIATPGTTVAPTATSPATTVTPTLTAPQTTVAPSTTVTPTTTVAPTTTATPTVTTTPSTTVTPTTTTTPTTTVAPTTTVTPTSTAGGQILSVIDWINQYPLERCEFARPTLIADNAATIEAFGKSTAPFEAMASAFAKDQGFELTVNLRQINDSQCAIADFMRDLKPRTNADGPVLSLKSTSIKGDTPVEGTIAGVAGWNTYLLLVDQKGSVQDLSSLLTAAGDTQTFAFSANAAAATGNEQLPMTLIAISSKTPLEYAHFSRTQAARVIFPVIRREIEGGTQDIAVSAQYFKLGS